MPKKKTARKPVEPRPSWYFVSTKFRPQLCVCGRLVLVGYAEGWKARVDPVELTPGQQAMCILGKLPFYGVDARGVYPVTPWRIGIPGARYPTHRCGVRWPQQQPRQKIVTKEAAPELPPY